MVGILLSYWEGLFSGAMLVSERVILHLFLPASICFFGGWRFGVKHTLKAAILTVISFSSHCLRALAAWMSLWLTVCQICRPHALPWHQNELWKFQATSWTSVTCLPLLVVNLGRWRKHAAIFDASVGFLRWDGCRAWGTKKPSSCNDFWKLTILSVLGRYFACLEPRFRFFCFLGAKLWMYSALYKNSHFWPCIDLSVQLCKWLYLHGCEGDDTDAGSDLCGPIHIRSYSTGDLGPTKCSRICRSLRYGSGDCWKLRDGSRLVAICWHCDPTHGARSPFLMQQCHFFKFFSMQMGSPWLEKICKRPFAFFLGMLKLIMRQKCKENSNWDMYAPGSSSGCNHICSILCNCSPCGGKSCHSAGGRVQFQLWCLHRGLVPFVSFCWG